ncbi:MAG: response regulator [Ignavibacteriales bacterium]|nr:response regulator [Ignavibacteriales bacterium]
MNKRNVKTILLVDDEPGWLSAMKAVLQESQLKVVTAESGEQAITQLKKKQPDLILCDVRMPVMNGYDVFLKIKEIPKANKVPFVFMSNFDDFDAKNVAKRLGADDYVAKPVGYDEVHFVINDLLQRFSKQKTTIK